LSVATWHRAGNEKVVSTWQTRFFPIHFFAGLVGGSERQRIYGTAQKAWFLGNRDGVTPDLRESGGVGGVFASSIAANTTCGPPAPPPLAVQLAVPLVTQD
jgi:hypothetical protein